MFSEKEVGEWFAKGEVSAAPEESEFVPPKAEARPKAKPAQTEEEFFGDTDLDEKERKAA